MSNSSQWTLFSNHGHVLIYLAKQPDVPLRQVAVEVGMTERGVQRIIADLEEGGYLVRSRKGRQNVYTINTEKKFRHAIESSHSIGEIINILAD